MKKLRDKSIDIKTSMSHSKEIILPDPGTTDLTGIVRMVWGTVILFLGTLWAWSLPTHATDTFMYLWQASLFTQIPVTGWFELIACLPKSFYSLLIFLTGLITHDPEASGIIVSLAAGVITVILTGSVAMQLADSNTDATRNNKLMIPLIACGILALHPVFINYSGRILSETTFAALSMLTVFAMIRLLHTCKFRFLLVAAVAIGFGALTREVGLAYLPVVALVPLACRISWGHRLVMSLFGIIIVIGITLPILISGAQSSLGQFNLIGHRSGYDVLAREREFLSLNDSATQFKIDMESQTSLIKLFTNNYQAMASRMSENFTLLLIIVWRISGWGVLIPATAGALLWLNTIKDHRSRIILFIFTGISMAAYLPFHLEFRYLVPVLPCLSIFAAVGITHVIRHAQRFRVRGILTTGLLCSAIGISLYQTYSVQVSHELWLKNNLIEEQELGKWLQTVISPGSIIMARKPDAAYYAGSEFVSLPYAPWPQIYKFACGRGVDILILSQRFAGLRPQLLPLYDSSLTHDGLQLLTKYQASNGMHLLVYRLSCPENSQQPEHFKWHGGFRHFGH